MQFEALERRFRKLSMGITIFVLGILVLLPPLAYTYDHNQRERACKARNDIRVELNEASAATRLAVEASIVSERKTASLAEGPERAAAERAIAVFEAASRSLGPIPMEECP